MVPACRVAGLCGGGFTSSSNPEITPSSGTFQLAWASRSDGIELSFKLGSPSATAGRAASTVLEKRKRLPAEPIGRDDRYVSVAALPAGERPPLDAEIASG